ncbi:MAG TPA: histidine kinase dimerization/phospho-acceptor domain-containing protein, partial [Nakamurella sp.]
MSEGTDPDQELLRSATRRMAWQLAAASAIVVILAALATLALSPVLGHGRDGRDGGPDRDDEVLRTTLLVAGGFGVVIAGGVGFLIARRAVAPLGDALARQRRFVADAGHELRTPLTVLSTRAQLIARRMPPDDPALPAMRQLLDDSRVLGEIVDELLASAQLTVDPGRGEPVDVRQLMQEVAGSMGMLADQHHVHLTVTVPVDARVNGSRVALRRALTALVDNAIGHTPADGFIDLAATVAGDRVVLSVTDTGEGLAGLDPAEL